MLGDTQDPNVTTINLPGWGPIPDAGTTVSSPASSGSGGFWSSPAWSAIGGALNNAAGILGTRYAVPQLNPGQMIQSGPYGTTLYQGGANSMYPGLPSLAGGGSSLLLLGGGALLLIVLMNKGKSN